MSNDRFRKAMGHIDDQLLERYRVFEEALPRRKKTRQLWQRMVAAAACLAVLISGVLIWKKQQTVPDLMSFTADEMMGLVGGLDGCIYTSAYIEGSTTSLSNLYFSALPKDAYLPIYESCYQNYTPDEVIPLDQQEATDFIDGLLPWVAASLGTQIPQYTLSQTDNLHLYMKTEMGQHTVSATQQSLSPAPNAMWVDRGSAETIVLDGTPLQITYSDDYDQMKAAISQLQGKICALFGKTFSSIQYHSSYNTYSEQMEVDVYLYEKSDHFINGYLRHPATDYIHVYFESEGAVTKNAPVVLNCSYIQYLEYRLDTSERFLELGQGKRLSIYQAEKLLEKGYVFGGHMCSICAKASVDFSTYDYVELVYQKGPVYSDPQDHRTGIEKYIYVPFYRFYKLTGQTASGDFKFIIAMVPAIEVSGLDEFFETWSQTHDHSQNR